MKRRRVQGLRLRHVWFASIAATCAGGLSIVTDAGAAPGDLRVLDPKTGLPKTWDSRVGTSPPPGGRVAPRAPGAVVDPCQSYTKASCADPTFATRCPNAAPACKSWKELDACAVAPPAGSNCGEAFYKAHKTELEAVPKVRRVTPSRRSLGTESKMTGMVKYDPAKVKVGGMDHAFATRLAHPAVRAAGAVRTGAATVGRVPQVTQMQAALAKLPKLAAHAQDVSGLIDSCDEYGARKYIELTQFDDAVSALQRDPRKTYEMIFGSAKWNGIVSKAQVRDSEGKPSTTAPTASLDVMGNVVLTPGVPLQFTPIAEGRNSFLSAAVGFARTFYDYDQYAKGQVAKKLPFPSLGLPDAFAAPPITAAIDDYQKKNEVFYNQELFTRRPFTANDSPVINETFQWHQAKNGALWEQDNEDKPGRYTDEELRIRYDRQQNLAALIAKRNEITRFVNQVGDICRTKTEPPPPATHDETRTRALGALLATYAAKIKSDPLVFFSKQYIDEIDPAFVQAQISKGWSMYDPITKQTTLMSGPSIKTPWAVQYMGGFGGNGPFALWGGSCRSQTGCPVSVVPVTFGAVMQRSAQLMAEAAQAHEYNQTIPQLTLDQHKAFQRAVNGAEIMCKGYGIPTMFAASGKPPPPADPNGLVLNLGGTPNLSAAEAQIVATALKGNILPKLEAVDALIYEQLGAGIELGCFGVGPANGCDWSPNRLIDFTHNYRHEMDIAREADVQRCQLYTTHDKNGFTYKSKLNDLMKSKGYNWNDKRKSVKEFESLLQDGESEILKQLKDEISAMIGMQVYDEDGKTPALGQISTTDGSFGSDMFGAVYGAGGGFRFGNLSTDKNGNWSKNDTTADASNFTYWAGNYANASVKILGTTNEVFNARMDIALTDGHLLDLQQGITQGQAPTDKQYLNGQVSGGRDYVGEKGGIKDTFQKRHAAAEGNEKNRIVQGHLHFRVVGDDLFDPINQTVQPTVFASTEPLYSFEPASYDRTLFDESTTIVIVIVPVSIRGWATFHAGVTYSIAASLDRGNIESLNKPAGGKPPPQSFLLNNIIEPYAEIDGNVSVAIGVPGMEVGVKGSLQLIRIGLPYHSSASVLFYNGGKTVKDKSAGNRFEASQGLDFTLSSLSGTVSGYVEILVWSAETELFHWDGITSTTPIFALDEVDASVHQSSQAVRDLVAAGYKIGQ